MSGCGWGGWSEQGRRPARRSGWNPFKSRAASLRRPGPASRSERAPGSDGSQLPGRTPPSITRAPAVARPGDRLQADPAAPDTALIQLERLGDASIAASLADVFKDPRKQEYLNERGRRTGRSRARSRMRRWSRRAATASGAWSSRSRSTTARPSCSSIPSTSATRSTSRNMQVWAAHNPFHYALVFADGTRHRLRVPRHRAPRGGPRDDRRDPPGQGVVLHVLGREPGGVGRTRGRARSPTALRERAVAAAAAPRRRQARPAGRRRARRRLA